MEQNKNNLQNNPPIQQPYMEEDEITLKELITKIGEYGREILKNWWLVGLITLLPLGYMLYKAYTEKTNYTAKLTFMLNAETGGGLGMVAGLLGSLGGGSAGKGDANFDKIMELSRSRKIAQEALFAKGVVDYKDDFYANHLIRALDIHKKWAKDTSGLKDFLFQSGDYKTFNRLQNKAYLYLEGVLHGNKDAGLDGTFGSSFSKQTEIAAFQLKTPSEDLSIQLLNTIYKELSEFYIAKTVEKQSISFKLMQGKRDSLQRVLNGREAGLASFVDRNHGLVLERVKTSQRIMEREKTIASFAYGEVVKNAETADFILKNKTPFVQLINAPMAPIKPEKPSKLKNALIGLALGLFLGSIFVVFRKIFRDAMA
jgi:hypothetical protein